jgi:hypothetical protein
MPKEKKVTQEAEPENYGMPANWSPVDAAPIVPGAPAGGTPPAPSGVNPFGSGALPSNLGLQPALVKTGYPPSTGPIELFPIAGGAAANAKTIGVAKTVATQAVAAAIAALPPAATPAATSDGLIHGETPWETDPAAFVIQDDFVGGGPVTGAAAATSGQIGSLGWCYDTGGIGGSPTSPYLFGGGPPPIFGEIRLPNNSISDSSNFLALNPNIFTSDILGNLWPLLDYPNWKLILDFRFMFHLEANAGEFGGATFSMAQKSFYAGLCCLPTSNNTGSSRPSVFLGVRYDTDTTSPAISDTTLKFEAVTNALSGTRNNTQGQVFDTGVVPVEGQQYRLEILCTAAGVVTLSLATGTAVVSSSITIAPISYTATGGTTGNGDQTRVTLGGSVIEPWCSGSKVTFTGFTGPEGVLGGTQKLVYSDDASQLFFLSTTYNTFNNFVAFTAAALPAYTPVVVFGTDTTATPTANASCAVDFFGFAWNPGVGGGTGTPNSNLPRYW